MSLPRIDSQALTAYFDEAQKIVYMRFHGSLTPAIVTSLYDWISTLIETVGVQNIRGAVNDLRGMTFLQSYSLGILAKESRKANARQDLTHIPTTYIVQNLLQDQIGRIAIKVAPNRRSVVRSEEEALGFIDEWYQQQPG